MCRRGKWAAAVRLSGEKAGQTPSDTSTRVELVFKDYKVRLPSGRTRPAARARTAEGKGAPHPGRGRPSPWLPEPLRPGKTQNAGATESALLWRTRKLEQHATQGPLHIEQPGACSVQTGKAQTPLYGANPVWPEHGECIHTQRYLSAAPRPPRSRTELN